MTLRRRILHLVLRLLGWKVYTREDYERERERKQA
jgi:hypothetical protein